MTELLQTYFAWHANQWSVQETGSDWTLFVSPHLDPSCDHIEVCVKTDDRNNILLSDDGQTLMDIETIYCGDLSASSKIRKHIDPILRWHNVKLSGTSELTAITPAATFSQAFFDFVNCMIEIHNHPELLTKLANNDD